MVAKQWVVDLRDKLPRHPTRRWSKRKKIKWLVIHCTASDNQDPFETNAYHISKGNHISAKGCPRIVYHDYITKTGVIFHCNDYSDWTWHAGWVNRWAASITMAYRGQDGGFPPIEQYEATLRHATKLCMYLNLTPDKIKGHREISGFWTWLGKGSKKYKTVCPGMAIHLDGLRTQVAIRMQRLLAAEGLYKGEIDGLFGKLSKSALSLYHQNLLVSLKNKNLK